MTTDHKPPFFRTTVVISIFLMAAGLVMAFMVIDLRFKNMAVVSEDILLATMAMLLLGAGIALTSFTNALRAKLILEAGNETEHVSSSGLQNARNKLLDAISDRMGSISLATSASLSSAAASQTLNPTFKDASGIEFQPEKQTLGLKWKSDHPDIAKVNDNGVITFVAAGTANITVTFRSITSNPCVVTCTA